MRPKPQGRWPHDRRGRRLALVAALVPGAALLVSAVNYCGDPRLLILALTWILVTGWRLRAAIAQELAPAAAPAPCPEFKP